MNNMIKGIDYIAVGCWGLVLNDQEEILLIKKAINDYWEHPGGNVEVGETLEECIVREVKEETGIVAKVVDFILFDQVFFGPEKKHWLAFDYELKYISGETINREPEKHDGVAWFKLSLLPSNLSPFTASLIERFSTKKIK
ncbi:MAG: NUDIX hydrolase [Candidatus Falkowbacteria bacterium]